MILDTLLASFADMLYASLGDIGGLVLLWLINLLLGFGLIPAA